MSRWPSDIRTCQRCGRRREARAQSKICFDCRYASSGPLPLVVDEPTPCYRSPDFLALEKEIEQRVARGQTTSVARYAEAEGDRFCGQCPLAEQCLERMQGGQYTGLAGGRLLINGQLRRPYEREVA